MNTSIVQENISKATLQLLWIGIGSICMFFAGLTSVIFVDKMTFPSTPDWFIYSTIAIVISSVILEIAKKETVLDKPAFNLILISFILGIFFTFCQFKGWTALVDNNIFFTRGGKEQSMIYVLTGAHLAHLFAGLIVLVVTAIKSKYGRYSSKDYIGLKLATTYWHFLTILWIYLYLFISFA